MLIAGASMNWISLGLAFVERDGAIEVVEVKVVEGLLEYLPVYAERPCRSEGLGSAKGFVARLDLGHIASHELDSELAGVRAGPGCEW